MKQNKTSKLIKARIFTYSFDISNKVEHEQYLRELETAKRLSGWNVPDKLHYISFCSISEMNKIKEFLDKLRSLVFIHIETEYLFNNQFNTKEGFRLWSWREYEYENKNIKRGYYIETPQKYLDLLNNTFVCGFCGKQYTRKEKENKDLTFCDSCLDSEYLKEDELFLLRLKRINDKTPRLSLSDCDKKVLKLAYENAQVFGNSIKGKARNKALRVKLKANLNKTIKDARTEYAGFIWCLNHNINTENLIYYNHTKTFCFGWKNKLDFELEQKLKEQLKNFPFNYEIKV